MSFSSVQAELTCNTNYWGTKNVCDILFKILKPGARVVNVSSGLGRLDEMKASPIKEKLILSGKSLTVRIPVAKGLVSNISRAIVVLEAFFTG